MTMRPDPCAAIRSDGHRFAANVREHLMSDSASLAHALAAHVAADINEGLDKRGVALIALSGGSTPRFFLRALAQCELDWNRVQVTVADERWVSESLPRSNAYLLREHLLRGAASAAQFISLHVNTIDPESALDVVAARLARMPLPFDAVVLGMGEDGHIASLFPGAPQLALALDPASEMLVLPMRASAAAEPRISLTLASLLQSRHLYLHIEGEAKWRVLAAALAAGESMLRYPVRALIEHAAVPVDLYWCPQ